MRAWNNAAYSDAQGTNASKKSIRIYEDLDLFFTRKLSDSDVATIKDVIAIKRSVRNLILLNHHEKPFHPEIAGGVREMLFENLSPVLAEVIRRKIEITIKAYEPRVELNNGFANVSLFEDEYGISPGQACVFYAKSKEGYKVLGGGWIQK